MDSYDDFAALYDEATTTDNKAKIALFKKLIAQNTPQARTLLEIGCGTGNILQAFESDYVCTGLDLSQGMLAEAANKLSRTTLVQGDMTNFDLGKQYDVILCVFNTINHLLEFEQWEQALERAVAHLAPGGLFIFDIYTKAMFDSRADDEPVTQWVGDDQVVSELVHERDNLYEWSIASIDEHGLQTQVYIPEVSFPIEQINRAVLARFDSVELTTGTKNPANEDAGRIYFVCHNG